MALSRFTTTLFEISWRFRDSPPASSMTANQSPFCRYVHGIHSDTWIYLGINSFLSFPIHGRDLEKCCTRLLRDRERPLHLQMEPTRDRLSRFVCSRLNGDTFLIVEHDSYDEHPFIYVKVYDDPPLLVLSDTGCGGVYTKVNGSSSANTIRDYLETYAVLDNDNKPLNPHDPTGRPEKQYLIICTHCHYDHILGLPYFADTSPAIVASSYGKSFVIEDLAEHSLCKYQDVAVPEYTVTCWAEDFEELSVNGHDLHIQVIHTPGHTPDELAWFDDRARHLYVGDSFYERVAKDKSYEQAIIFPKEGNLVQFMQSLDKLIHFLSRKDAEEDKGPIKIACGHVTSAAPGKDILISVKTVFSDLVNGSIPIVLSMIKRGEQYHVWKSTGDTRFLIEAPLRLVEDAKQAVQEIC